MVRFDPPNLPGMLARLSAHRRGNLSVVTALLIAPLMALAGFGTDIGHAVAVKVEFQEAADSAVLNAVRSDALGEVLRQPGNEKTVFKRINAEVERLFQDNLSAETATAVEIRADSEVHSTASDITVRLTFKARIGTTFLRAIGKDVIEISGIAEANSSSMIYSTLHLFLDNSPSMGIPLSLEDMALLKSATVAVSTKDTIVDLSAGCVLACHDLNPDPKKRQDLLPIARLIGVKLRIDAAKDAATQLADALAAYRTAMNQISMRLYSFGTYASEAAAKGYVESGSATRDVATFKTRVNGVQLLGLDAGNEGRHGVTNLPGMLDRFQAKIPAQAAGTTPAKPRQVLLMVLDGISNLYPSTYRCFGTSETSLDKVTLKSKTQCWDPIQPAQCAPLKDRGIPVAIVYIPYPQMTYDGNYMKYIDNFAGRVEAKLKECASPGLFLRVEDADSLNAAMKALFFRATAGPRLTG